MNRLTGLLVLIVLCCGGNAIAADPRMEISETALNKMIGRLGTMAAGGVAQPYNVHNHDPLFTECFTVGFIGCPGLNAPGLGVDLGQIPLLVCNQHGGGYSAVPAGDLVSWQWWVSNAYLTVSANAMTFTATVLTRVGDHWAEESRTVGASVLFDTTSNRLRLRIDNFQAYLALQNTSTRLDADPIDVSGMYSLAMDVPPQLFSVLMPTGAYQNINARIVDATPSYAPDKVTVTFDVDF